MGTISIISCPKTSISKKYIQAKVKAVQQIFEFLEISMGNKRFVGDQIVIADLTILVN